ncbi:hypothetical protein DLAC_07917 [Tieghemostelium lacteum]|uniref:Snurportin-1 n=1 Tax=Tieghemostelium lacteum TaxID=361077 RepID=A0A151ZAR0_TIELA|nr:hypothetical protein DLAC_07917 [Tieghemostelium lacteum]|eukprot:KYQ91018.1 hypothetical protein DLAC_07917 [Tieghemostelium lacteum]
MDSLSALLGTSKIRDDRDYHNFTHRVGSFKATSKDDGLERRIKYSLEKQKERRRNLISQVRSIISPTNNNTETLDTSVDSTNAECNSMEGNELSNTDISFNDSLNDQSIDFEIDDQDDNLMTFDKPYNNNNYNNNNNSKSKNKKKKNKRKPKKSGKEERESKQVELFSNHLMLAEPMEEIPTHFEEEWVVMCAPSAKRCIVVAQNDNTTIRNPDGEIIMEINSLLPYGSAKSREPGPLRNQHVILDCLLDEQSHRIFIMDVLSWKGFLLYDYDSDFRFFWRDQKLSETFNIQKQVVNDNPYSFHSLYYYESDCKSLESLRSDVNQKKVPYPVDYLLFYHKQSHYEFGVTPLFSFIQYSDVDILISELQKKSTTVSTGN